MVAVGQKFASYSFDRLKATDVVAESTRRSMQGNRAKDTQPEVRLRKALWQAGIRGYRKHHSKLPGEPDIVYGKAKLAIFVHGCYWHQCTKCARNRTPATNREYWSSKFEANMARDLRHETELRVLGYEVIVAWECEIKADIDLVVGRVRRLLER